MYIIATVFLFQIHAQKYEQLNGAETKYGWKYCTSWTYTSSEHDGRSVGGGVGVRCDKSFDVRPETVRDNFVRWISGSQWVGEGHWTVVYVVLM